MQLVAKRSSMASPTDVWGFDMPGVFAYAVVRLPTTKPCGLELKAQIPTRIPIRDPYRRCGHGTRSEAGSESESEEVYSDGAESLALREQRGAFAAAYSDCRVSVAFTGGGHEMCVEAFVLYALVWQVCSLCCTAVLLAQLDSHCTCCTILLRCSQHRLHLHLWTLIAHDHPRLTARSPFQDSDMPRPSAKLAQKILTCDPVPQLIDSLQQWLDTGKQHACAACKAALPQQAGPLLASLTAIGSIYVHVLLHMCSYRDEQVA